MKEVSCLLSLESSSGASGIDIAGAPKSRLHSAYTVLSGRHTDDDDFALNVRFVCSIVCVMYKSLGGRLRNMDV